MSEVVNMIVLGGNDNVGVALRDIAPGETAVDARGLKIVAGEAVPQGHKMALVAIAAGERIIRMDVAVGIARAPIAVGTVAHIHNIRSQYLDNVEDHYE